MIWSYCQWVCPCWGYDKVRVWKNDAYEMRFSVFSSMTSCAPGKAYFVTKTYKWCLLFIIKSESHVTSSLFQEIGTLLPFNYGKTSSQSWGIFRSQELSMLIRPKDAKKTGKNRGEDQNIFPFFKHEWPTKWQYCQSE